MPIKKIKLVCLNCDKNYVSRLTDYKRRGSKFCSHKCYFEFIKSVYVEIECKWCGETKTVRELYVKRGQYKYCSEACRQEAERKGIAIAQLTRECETCSAVFRIKPSELKKNRRHCSKKCSHRREMRICNHCKCEYERVVSGTNKQFCSQSCYHKYKGETKIEELVRKHLDYLQVKYECQKQFGRFTVDFIVESSQLIVEADGKYWHSKSQEVIDRDNRKDKILQEQGYTVLRLKEDDINSGIFKKDLNSCLN